MKQNRFKLSMLSFGKVLHLSISKEVVQYCLRRMLLASRNTEWGSVFTESEFSQIPNSLYECLTSPWSDNVRALFQDVWDTASVGLLAYAPGRHCPLFIPKFETTKKSVHTVELVVGSTIVQAIKLPGWFRWLVPFYLAISATPRDADDLAALNSSHLAIRHVITVETHHTISGDNLRAFLN